MEEHYIGITCDAFYPIKADGNHSVTELGAPTIYDVTWEKVTWSNNDPHPLYMAINLIRCVKFAVKTNYQYGTPSMPGSAQYGIYSGFLLL
jgi:hypothetical protein